MSGTRYPSGGGGGSGLTIGTTAITGGTDTRVLFNDGAVVGEDAGLTYNKTSNVLTVTAGGLTFATSAMITMPVTGGAGVAQLGLATTDGISFRSNGTIDVVRGGVGVATFNSAGVQLFSTLSFAGDSTFAVAPDLVLIRDAANTYAQRNGTASQSRNHYDTFTSTTDYHRLAIKTARATLSNVSGASVTATGLIPDGAVLVGLTSKVTTGLGVTGGTNGYTIGDGSDVDRWGAIVGTASGTSSDNTNWTATTVQAFNAAQDVVVTASGGNFDATGVIYLSAQYLIGQCD